MNFFVGILIAGLMAMVVFSLVRGIIAFLHSSKLDLEREPGSGATEMQLLQNKMMFARIKWQALAVVVVALLLAFGRS
jgi:predicted RND superfamily exporter protein